MKSIYSTLVFCLSIIKVLAQTTSPAFDSSYAQQLNQRLQSLGSSSGIKGLSAAAFIPGQGHWVGTYGQAAPSQPLQPNMRLGIASNTKAIVAALLLKLQEEKLLDLDDPVSQYLPPHPHVNGQITLRQLLTHTSGLFDFLNDWSGATSAVYNNNPDSTWAMNDLLATIGPPHFQPGRRYSYSNTNYLLAGMVAEAAADTTIGYLLHSRIFEPLGLGMAYPVADDIFAAPFANLWNGSSVALSPDESNAFLSFSATAGAIWSTAHDMVRWYDALFGHEWLHPQSQQELRNYDGYSAYTLGLRVQNYDGASIFYHAGAWGYRSYMLHEPASGISVCVLGNVQGHSVTNIAQSLFKEIRSKKPKKPFDLTAQDIVYPAGNICATDQTPVQVQIRNNGLLALDTLQVVYGFDGIWEDTIMVVLPTPLLPGSGLTLPLNLPILASDYDKHRLQLSIQSQHGDGYEKDNLAYADYQFVEGEGLPLPYHEGFEMTGLVPSNWVSEHPEDLMDWRRSDFAAAEGHSSLARNNYWDGNEVEVYPIELPALRIDHPAAALSFDFAHTPTATYTGDVLRGYVSTDCGETYWPLFVLADDAFQTAPVVEDVFLPAENEWVNKTYSLENYAGKTVNIRFEMVNGYGNNLYLDNVRVQYALPVKEISPLTMEVYPNPATDYVEVNLPVNPAGSVSELVLLDAFGKAVFKLAKAGSGSLRIPRGGLPAGIYILQLREKGQVKGAAKVVFI
ncbi:MAG: serine hydrolase [Saprospiraceae bacterium]|nr:serine hydrolase [Saprospiraceae bacterium]